MRDEAGVTEAFELVLMCLYRGMQTFFFVHKFFFQKPSERFFVLFSVIHTTYRNAVRSRIKVGIDVASAR